MVFLDNCTLFTGTGQVLKGSLLIEDGKIKEMGPDCTPPDDAEYMDLEERIVTPGFIDAHTHVGISEAGLGWEGQDYNEIVDPITPHLRAIDAINPMEPSLLEARKAGVTAVMTGPGSANVIGGEMIVMRTQGQVIDDMILKNPAGIKAALGENPKRLYGQMRKPASSPVTRMATAALLRETLMKAQDYKKKREDSEKDEGRDMKLETMVKVLNGELPLRVHAHRADDIMTALRVAKEFAIDITLEHCTEGHKIASYIKDSGFPAIVGPTLGVASKIEVKDSTWETPNILYEAGVTFAIMTDHPVIPIEHLNLCAALAVKAGLPEQEAIKAITLSAAKIAGVADRVGSLEKGKDADLVIWDGHPLEIQSRPYQVYIEGKLIQE